MKQTKEYIEDLLTKFLTGETSEAEEQTLTEFFCSENDIPTEWLEYKVMFQSFNTDAYNFCDDEIEAMLTPTPKKKSQIIHLLIWASVACMIAVVAFLWLMNLESDIPTHSPAIAEVKKTDKVQHIDSVQVQSDIRATDNMVETPMKRHTDRKTKPPRKKTPEIQEISTAELIETVNILAEVCSEDFTLTAASDNEEYNVKVSSGTGMTNYYRLRRCADSSSNEMTSKTINF